MYVSLLFPQPYCGPCCIPMACCSVTPVSLSSMCCYMRLFQTYTMLGSATEPGIMMRVMNDLFMYSEKNAKDDAVVFTVTVSFLEVSKGERVK